MSAMVERLRREMVRGMVQRRIFCPVTEEVLDFRTCVVLVDKDGDPAYVLSQDGWRSQTARQVLDLEKLGLTVDEATVDRAICGAHAKGAVGDCVRFPKHRGKHRDAHFNEFDEVASS